ncbi:MAG: hypothetical protein JXJ22_00720 [Bacteroidales bacterium]|nr:hypothetical protein [Bacteroidales bacterium]
MSNTRILAVNISEKKGTIKKPVESISINAQGVAGDAHAGDWNRQLSLLGIESIKKFEKEAGRKIVYGEFAENITTEGILLYNCSPLDRFIIGNTELEVTQIGKKCHGSSCAIFKEVGNCVMPKEGIFCRVIKGGKIQAGDILTYLPKTIRIQIITLSDRASKGIYKDISGPKIEEIVLAYFSAKNLKVQIDREIIADHPEMLKKILFKAQNNSTDIIFTTGGTGIGPRDITPDVVKPLLDKELPGIMEFIRIKYGTEKPNALLSRGVAGSIGQSLVYTLPGNVKAINEYLSVINNTLIHALYMLHGLDLH